MADEKPRFTAKMGVGCFIAILGLLISMPLWYWLVYEILVRVQATTLMWVFFWIYAPVGFLIAILKAVLEGMVDRK